MPFLKREQKEKGTKSPSATPLNFFISASSDKPLTLSDNLQKVED